MLPLTVLLNACRGAISRTKSGVPGDRWACCPRRWPAGRAMAAGGARCGPADGSPRRSYIHFGGRGRPDLGVAPAPRKDACGEGRSDMGLFALTRRAFGAICRCARRAAGRTGAQLVPSYVVGAERTGRDHSVHRRARRRHQHTEIFARWAVAGRPDRMNAVRRHSGVHERSALSARCSTGSRPLTCRRWATRRNVVDAASQDRTADIRRAFRRPARADGKNGKGRAVAPGSGRRAAADHRDADLIRPAGPIPSCAADGAPTSLRQRRRGRVNQCWRHAGQPRLSAVAAVHGHVLADTVTRSSCSP